MKQASRQNAWTSFDQTPWAHPWLSTGNLSRFSVFSRQTLDQLSEVVRNSPNVPARYAFVGNLANCNYMRASVLARKGLPIDLFLHPGDHSLMSQPFWEDFNGEIKDLSDKPSEAALNAPLPKGVFRLPIDENWSARLSSPEFDFVDPIDVRDTPEFMPFLPLFSALQSYDAIALTQTFAFGPLTKRPYLISPSGGDMWFDPSRGDNLGRITIRALREAYAIMVSNPITLAHARRYRLVNCVYMPFFIDEERYHPGDEHEVREEWQMRSGGSFFVLTSMRIDDKWKGAGIALEGFARLARQAPEARLVILGWGVDKEAFMNRVQGLDISDRVILLPIVGKKLLARYLRAADVLIEQFVLGYYGSSALEAMASGLPVVMRVEKSQYDALKPGGCPPVLGAADAQSVADKLKILRDSPTRRKNLSEATRQWFLNTHASSVAYRDFRTLLQAAGLGVPIKWGGSPLSEPRTNAESEYLEQRLMDAPPFPNYLI